MKGKDEGKRDEKRKRGCGKYGRNVHSRVNILQVVKNKEGRILRSTRNFILDEHNRNLFKLTIHFKYFQFVEL